MFSFDRQLILMDWFQTCRKGQVITQTYAYLLSAYRPVRTTIPSFSLGEPDIERCSPAQLEAHVARAVQIDQAWKVLCSAAAPRRQGFGAALMASEKYNVHGPRLLMPRGRWLLSGYSASAPSRINLKGQPRNTTETLSFDLGVRS